VLLVLLVAACNTAELRAPPPQAHPTGGPAAAGEETASEEEEEDTESVAQRRDGGASDAAAPVAPPADSGANLSCPAPAKITPADVPAGFLAPVKVTNPYLADGDSGEFTFPGGAKHSVRLLWVNTEESGGPEKTQFGYETKPKVLALYKAATDIQVAVQETSKGSGVPKEDPFDRWLSLVFLDGELVQTRLVRDGLSAYYTQFGCAPAPVHNALLYAEAEANDNDRGIWGPGPHNDYEKVFGEWIGNRTCRPNPYKAPYCR
jgi:endonuclease YncB( thermonuclease family)